MKYDFVSTQIVATHITEDHHTDFFKKLITAGSLENQTFSCSVLRTATMPTQPTLPYVFPAAPYKTPLPVKQAHNIPKICHRERHNIRPRWHEK
ncbi:MAG TPA: hypothetical protein VGE06_06055, partial [Flavisolibacter sp.]